MTYKTYKTDRTYTAALAVARGLIAVGLMFAVLGTAGPVRAHGTHFILEGEGGVGLTNTALVSSCYGLTLGYGGRFRGAPLRYYLVASYSRGMLDADLDNSISYANRSVSENVLTVGPRLYIPVAKNVRIFFQGLGGFATTTAYWKVNDVESYRADDTGLAARFSGGIQARLAPWMSLGFSMERLVFWNRENEQATAAFVGFSQEVDEGDQSRLLGTFTWHF